ncbi:MAG: flagellar biosynthesis protein FlhF [Selenomonadaceae bacterium]|nr:flagellar biosynthesis protein FlhF [Selenomonadaceae bacterium]
MILAQFNQMQMMQQAALAQAQANAQAQAQAAEQLRLQQEAAAQAQQAALQAQAQAQQAQAQAQARAKVQPQQEPTDPQSEDKIKRLEEEISHMKALLAEVLGREPKKGNISLHEALKLQEVDDEILTEMATQANAGDTLVDIHAPTAKGTLINYLNEHIKFSDGVKLNRHGVRIAALLGTTGVGKTTTLAKIAAKFVLEQKTNVALITADTYRISAVEQLKTYSDILELPLEIVYSPSELASALERHRDKELILIDTAGRSQHNEYQMRELEEFLRVNPRIEKHLVISATTKFTDARQIMNKFSKVEPDRIIFTKIDETGSLGMIINLLRDNKYSLSYLTTGQSVPDDIERASSEILANLLLKKVEE